MAWFWMNLPTSIQKKLVNSLHLNQSSYRKNNLVCDYYHKVRINYYPPRNDNKEGWDNIDIFGWMGYPMKSNRLLVHGFLF